MKPAPFEYRRPADLAETLALLAEVGDDAKILAGGQSLVPAMNFRLARPAMLIDINHVDGLAYFHEEAAGLRIGAMTRHAQVERSPLVARRLPLLHATMPWVAHAQIRSRGTFGGSLVHADPAAELPAVALALGATMRLQSANGEREVAAEDFFVGLFETVRQPDELLVEILVPELAPGAGWSFQEFSRRHGDFALAGVVATVELGADGVCRAARLALLAVDEKPLLAPRTVAALIGQRPSPELCRAAAAVCALEEVQPGDDLHATAAYRRHLVEVLTRRALTEAFARAGAAFQH